MAKARAWLKKTFTWRPGGWDLLFAALLTVVFFALPVFLSPDSDSYLHNARVLAGELPFSEWDSLRGPVLPALLRLSFGIFGESAYGTAVTLYLLYAVFVAATLYLCHLLGLAQMLGKPLTWLVCTLFIFLNPTVLTYSHYVLTEFVALVVAVPVCCAIAKTHLLLKRGGAKKRWFVLVARYAIVILSVVALYALKQMFFIFTAVPFFLSEVILLCGGAPDGGKFSLKQLGASALAVLLLCGSIPAWSAGWDAAVSSGNAEVREDLSASSIAYSSLIDGMRYFRPEERYTTGKAVRIDVMSDGYKKVEKSFTYTFDGSFAGSLDYLATCFAQSPGRFVASWAHNYFVIANVRRLMDYSVTRAYTPVTKTNWFWQSFETQAWLERYKELEKGTTGYTELSPSNNPQFEQPVDDGLVSNLLFNTGYPVFSYFMYSFPAFCAPWVMLASIALSIWRRKTEKAAFWHRMTVLSGSVFLCIFALAVTASNIDRYGFPATVWCALMVIYPAVTFLRWAWRAGAPWVRQKLKKSGP